MIMRKVKFELGGRDFIVEYSGANGGVKVAPDNIRYWHNFHWRRLEGRRFKIAGIELHKRVVEKIKEIEKNT